MKIALFIVVVLLPLFGFLWATFHFCATKLPTFLEGASRSNVRMATSVYTLLVLFIGVMLVNALLSVLLFLKPLLQ